MAYVSWGRVHFVALGFVWLAAGRCDRRARAACAQAAPERQGAQARLAAACSWAGSVILLPRLLGRGSGLQTCAAAGSSAHVQCAVCAVLFGECWAGTQRGRESILRQVFPGGPAESARLPLARSRPCARRGASKP